MKNTILFILCTTIILLISVSAQESKANNSRELIKVYLECDNCDISYIKQNMQFVNFVRDRSDADVHVQSNTTNTGSGGERFTFTVYGLKRFENKNDTLSFSTNITDTEETERQKFVRTLKLALIPYIIKSSAAEKIEISFDDSESDQTSREDDPWDFWVFRVGLSTYFEGEKSSSEKDFDYSFTSTRITEDWKFRLGFNGEYEETNFDYEDQTIKNVSRNLNSYNYLIGSISEHWSIGAWLYMISSTYQNYDFKSSLAPGVEYNIFPYSEFNSRQLRFEFKVWNKIHNYNEETIYFKKREFLIEPEIQVTLDLIEQWGSISISALAATHVQDFEKNRLRISGSIYLQLVKGLTFDIRGGFSAIHDQFSIPRSEASLDDILLEQRELETDFDYWISFGLSYTFGSIYSNIVNPRFGS